MANEICKNLLIDGVYAKHNLIRTENHDENYQHYFSSDEFKNDFKNNKYNLGVEVVIYDVPIKLSYGSDETQINEFQKKVREATNFKLKDNFFLTISDSYADKNLLDAFNACVGKGLGFNITVFPTGQTITFKVVYSNLGQEQPILEDVYISTGNKLLYQSLKKGEKFEDNLEAIFTFELDSNTKELLFVVDTNISASSEKVILSKRNKNDGSPIGTIITSFLSWTQFQSVTENNKESGGIWRSDSSFWAPCDGRAIPNSEFQKITSLTNVPDLRGVFLRGLNTFDFAETSIVPSYQADLENRKIGSFQSDTIVKHVHNHNRAYGPGLVAQAGTGAGVIYSGYDNPSNTDIQPNGSDETRPKNVAINYFVRIN